MLLSGTPFVLCLDPLGFLLLPFRVSGCFSTLTSSTGCICDQAWVGVPWVAGALTSPGAESEKRLRLMAPLSPADTLVSEGGEARLFVESWQALMHNLNNGVTVYRVMLRMGL